MDGPNSSTFGKLFWAGVISTVLAIASGLGLLQLKFGRGVIHLSYDLPYAIRPVIRPQEAALVYVDEDSYRALNQPYNVPWDRSLYAQLLERLTAEGAKAVVFDVVFSDPGPTQEADERLAKAIHAHGKVVLATDYVISGYGIPGAEKMKQIVPPHEFFRDAGGIMGSDEHNPDDDLILRRHLMISRDDQVDQISWVAAKLVGAEVAKDDENKFQERWRNYYGPAATIRNASFYRAILTNSPDYEPLGFFSNRVVFVGSRLLTRLATERKDEFPTPHTRWTQRSLFMPGVEIHAMAFLNLLRGDWIRRLPQNVEAVILAFVGVLLGFGLIRQRPIVATGVSFAIVAAVTLAAYFSFAYARLWFPWLIIVIQVCLVLAWSIVFNSIQLYVQNKLYQASLEMYLSPKLVKKFSTNRDLLRPGAKKETLTILFTDIANFTSISEGMEGNELCRHMNKYFELAVGNCIHHTDGTVVKYIGDAVFAFWNAPDPQNDHKLRACEAAVAFRNLPPQHMNGQLLITRIGLHTGVANVGNFGSTARVDYTALGENINLAARMEGLNKYLGTIVLLTSETHAGIEDKFTTRYLGDFRLKGFEKSVGVYELVGLPDKAEGSRPLHEAFATALNMYRKREFAKAEAAFGRVLEIKPEDGPSKFYLKHLEDLKIHPPPATWSGDTELKEK